MMAGVVAFAVLVLLALLIFGLAWVGSFDRGPNPRETFDLQDRRRRAEAMRVEEGGLCCCDIHQPWMCEVHASEGEALGPCRCTYDGQTWCEVHGMAGEWLLDQRGDL